MRHAGEQHDDVAVGFEPERWSGAARIRQHRGAFGDHRLAFIYFGHGARKTAKALLDFAHDGFLEMQLAAEKFCDGFAGAVVVGGAQAAARDDQVGAIECVTEGGAHLAGRIADDGLVDYTDADFI